ncbi:hypothetical protein KC19_1G283500 [Ceratodon purpureus]|uniref:Uncharacterized protein n=1 Tax=Ceratodon purpureus TaxID=3225 RepID=A0A8T0JA92_CERPU|nr:hypothetical protein KC19_1G283500 [Ceratodon purpureus]
MRCFISLFLSLCRDSVNLPYVGTCNERCGIDAVDSRVHVLDCVHLDNFVQRI